MNASYYPSFRLRQRMKPADRDDSGRPMYSPDQEDAIARRREECADYLRKNRAFVANVFDANEELKGIVASAYLAGDMNRAREAMHHSIEHDIRETFRVQDEDFDNIEAQWRAFEREMPREVLP